MWIEPPIDLNRLPREPGIYRMLDRQRQVLYVGKARNLHKRVSSYFQRRPESHRIEAMVRQVRDIEIVVTASEAEALILEHNLIKQLKPRYNVLLKDSKSYPYILLTDEPFPRLCLYRGNKSEAGEYFGPFPNAGAVRRTLHALQKVFRIRDCENAVFRHRSRPCLQYQIGRCSGPCCGLISEADYARQVRDVRAFLRGRDRILIDRWERKMQQAAAATDFERAALFRDRIRALRSILAGSGGEALPDEADAITILRNASGVVASIGVRRGGRDLGAHQVRVAQAVDAEDLEILQSLFLERYRHEAPAEILVQASKGDVSELQRLLRLLQPQSRTRIRAPQRGARAEWLKNVRAAAEKLPTGDQQEALGELQALLGLEEIPQRLAAVDNAHLGGQQMVAAIVYADRHGMDKDHYRRYKLDDVPAGDDYAAMRSVLGRFFRAIGEETLPEPDVMLIDGGRGQLAAAMEAAAECGLSGLKLVAVAKGTKRRVGEETLWLSWRSEPLKPGRTSPALLLIARVRDEAHRFAGAHMRKRKKKSMFVSELDRIPGIGAHKRAALLRHFGGIEGVRKAGREQLAAVPGVSKVLAERVFTALHR